MQKTYFGHIVICWVFLTLNSLAFSQASQEVFGKNRMQYKSLVWQYYKTQNFDIYYYQGGENLAKMASKFVESEFEKIVDIIGYAPFSRSRIFIYLSNKDLLQSNIGVNKNSFNIGGQTNFVKSQTEISFPGTISAFKLKLRHQLAEVLINDMMFGGSLVEMFQSAYLMSLPHWFVKGAARYIGYGWDIEMDDFMRSYVSSNKPIKLDAYKGEEAALIGQSFWNYIDRNYGRSNFSNILNLTRIIRNEELSISNTLGLGFQQIINEWMHYYVTGYDKISEQLVVPDQSLSLRRGFKKGKHFRSIALNQTGNLVAWTENYQGSFEVRVKDLQTGKVKKMDQGGYKLINQEVDHSLPLIDWKDEQTLAILSVRRGRWELELKNINNGFKEKRKLGKFDHIQSLDFSENGKLALFSASINGKSDLYLLSLNKNKAKRLTNTYFDDIDAKFVPKSTKIVYASNDPQDSTLKKVKKEAFFEIPLHYNLFMIDIKSKKIKKLTNALGHEVRPVPINYNKMLYLGGEKGIYNLYSLDASKGISQQVSAYHTSLIDFDYNTDNQSFAYFLDHFINERIYAEQPFDISKSQFTPQTPRQEFLNAQFISASKSKSNQNKSAPKDSEQANKINQQTYPKGHIDTENYTFTQIGAAESNQTPKSDSINTTGRIDTDQYSFKPSSDGEQLVKNDFLLKLQKRNGTLPIMQGPFPALPLFSIDNAITSFVLDPLVGFGIQIETQMNDILENHKFYGGVIVNTDLRSGSFFGEYNYLKHIVDFHARFDRRGLFKFSTETGNQQKYRLTKFELGAAMPLNIRSRIKLSPFFAITEFYDLNSAQLSVANGGLGSGQTNESIVNYVGGRVDFIFDNSIVRGLNILEGARAKISLFHYEGINQSHKSISNISVDIRRYQKIHRELILAARFFYGNFFGPNKPDYLLGGMENWLFYSTASSTGDHDPLRSDRLIDNSNQLFLQYIPLRGFRYNTLNGNEVMSFSTELRFPIVKYFYRGAIASSFFNNLQLTGFFDIGSSWRGISPFHKENSINTEIIGDTESSFEAKINNFRNPWLSSYGVGARSMIMSYYMRFDLAWPIVDFQVDTPKFYITLGYDF